MTLIQHARAGFNYFENAVFSAGFRLFGKSRVRDLEYRHFFPARWVRGKSIDTFWEVSRMLLESLACLSRVSGLCDWRLSHSAECTPETPQNARRAT